MLFLLWFGCTDGFQFRLNILQPRNPHHPPSAVPAADSQGSPRLSAAGTALGEVFKVAGQIDNPYRFDGELQPEEAEEKVENPWGVRTSMKKEDMRMLHQVLFDFNRIMSQQNLEYSIINGGLLGAIRHKGIIPWDDDCDLVLHESDKETFRNLPWAEWGYGLVVPGPTRIWKVEFFLYKIAVRRCRSFLFTVYLVHYVGTQ